MDELRLAADRAMVAYEQNWRRGFIERSHAIIARQRSTRMFREHIDQLYLDIEDVLREAAIINI